KYESEASKYWDTFYKIHKNKFFKDRNWLLREFPEILPVDEKIQEKVKEFSWDHVKANAANCFSRMHCLTMPEQKNHYKKSAGSADGQSKAGSDFSNLDAKEHRKGPVKTELFPGSNATFRILEVGCGVGNSVFPILNTLQNSPESFLYCCDFASEAVELVKLHLSYRAGQCCAFVHDVCDDSSPYPFPDGILDVILLVFVLSSIHPDRLLERNWSNHFISELSITVRMKDSPLVPVVPRDQLWDCLASQDARAKESSPTPAVTMTQTSQGSWKE
ncbi:hypothetical protein MC885_021281, partial [Smutsia gigantea]